MFVLNESGQWRGGDSAIRGRGMWTAKSEFVYLDEPKNENIPQIQCSNKVLTVECL